ncbi:head GIN domain-containing protein [Croceivirga radicis]|uniref:head GIN domain-containing protein n=1 Tax=Croceivirga radicis TaxID=1929488 RepID=UPI000255B40E|nr:head GIN domain-containing protein [Croceivirga radicis]
MKKIVTLLILAISSSVFSQRMIENNVGDFHKIKVFDLIEVNLIQSDEDKIIIKGLNVDDIKWTNNDGVLKLRMQLDKKFTGEDTFIEVYYKDIDVIDGNEGAKIVCNELIEQNRIELRTQEGARIIAGLDVEYSEMRAVTGGILEVSGLAENQTVTLNTGGIFEGRELRTMASEVKISAGGEAEVYASESIDVNVKAGGDVDIFGNPKKVRKKTLVGGSIRVRN